jgi:hypothetical protein
LAVVAATVFLFLGGQALFQVVHNERLTGRTPGELIGCEVRKTGRDRFAIWAHYAYTVQEQRYEGHDWLNEEDYRNPWTAKRDIDRRPEGPVSVRYQPKRPQQSALCIQSARPTIMMAALAALLTLYFAWMGRRKYVHA